MAPEISKCSTVLITKYIYIKTAAHYLFLTIEVAKIKRKDNNDGIYSHWGIMGEWISATFLLEKQKNWHVSRTLIIFLPFELVITSLKVSLKVIIFKCIKHNEVEIKVSKN